MPSCVADFKGLLKAAIRDENPVLFFVDLALLNQEDEIPAGDHVVPLGRAVVRRGGSDVTLVSYAKTMHTCLQAAQALAAKGVSAEVIDLRTIKPLDERTLLASARKTGRVVVVHEASRTCGVGAEVAALVAEHAFDALKVPVVRLTGPDAPAAASYPLEQAYAPQASDIEAATLALLRRNMAIA
jgi:pyruvate dehydrogenase E1 component beta subunit